MNFNYFYLDSDIPRCGIYKTITMPMTEKNKD